jgi:hypothetical protein
MRFRVIEGDWVGGLFYVILADEWAARAAPALAT